MFATLTNVISFQLAINPVGEGLDGLVISDTGKNIQSNNNHPDAWREKIVGLLIPCGLMAVAGCFARSSVELTQWGKTSPIVAEAVGHWSRGCFDKTITAPPGYQFSLGPLSESVVIITTAAITAEVIAAEAMRTFGPCRLPNNWSMADTNNGNRSGNGASQ